MLYQFDANRTAVRSNWLKETRPELYWSFFRGNSGITQLEGTYFDHGTYKVMIVPNELLK